MLISAVTYMLGTTRHALLRVLFSFSAYFVNEEVELEMFVHEMRRGLVSFNEYYVIMGAKKITGLHVFNWSVLECILEIVGCVMLEI